MGYWRYGAFAVVVVACNRDKTSPAPSDPSLMSAADFCGLVLEAPKRHLESRCSPDDKLRAPYQRLVAVASRPVRACVAALEPGVTAGRLKLHRSAAEACARAIEAAPWKSSLRTRELAAYPECKGLTTGTQAEGGNCRASLDCASGLWCAGASFESDGSCRKPGTAGQTCEAPLLFLFDETAAVCSAGHGCDFGSFRPAYALGYPPRVSASLERELAKRRSLPDSPPKTIRKNDPLADAAEFGMRGLLNPGITARDAGRGVGIGLGGIGTGFSSGHGRLGGSRNPPRVRMGATSVSGRLPPEVIQRIVRQNFGRFRLCYESGLRKNPKLEGRVSVRFVIGRDGSVSSVRHDGDFPDQAVAECVSRAFSGLSFPQPEGGTVSVTYPLVFGSGEPPPKSAKRAEGTDAGSADAGPSDSAGASPSAPPAAAAKALGTPFACAALAVRGSPCAAAHQCAGGLVCRVGRCEPAGAAGDACESDIECKPDMYCGVAVDAAGARGSCKPLESTGAACASSSECLGACGPEGKCIALCGAG